MNRPSLPALFIADAPGLDFLNSIATLVDVEIDWIDSGEGLLSWLEEASLIPKPVLDSFRKRASPAELDAVAAQARSLREWFRGFIAQHKGQPLTPEALGDIEPLRRLLERDETFTEIVAHDHGEGPVFALESQRRWRSPESLLMPVAQSLAKLICDEDFSHVKACEGPHCTMLFADHTHGHSRRWCSMALCGNRAKVAAHRKRQKETLQDPLKNALQASLQNRSHSERDQ
jgi:predicted RNA-binding Zn ribbon-like protein